MNIPSKHIRELSRAELDAVAGAIYTSSWNKCLDGKMMFVSNLDLGGGVIIVTSWKDDGKGVQSTVVHL